MTTFQDFQEPFQEASHLVGADSMRESDTFQEFQDFQVEAAPHECWHLPKLTRDGKPRHPHSQPCPCCGRWVKPYDDEPWPEGGEWTSAHDCKVCAFLWTAGWQYPSGEPFPDSGSATPRNQTVETVETVASERNSA